MPLGILGNKIRVTHYCHHEEIYPYDDMISDEYKTSHDVWPWFIPLIIFGYIPLYIVYKRYKLDYNFNDVDDRIRNNNDIFCKF